MLRRNDREIDIHIRAKVPLFQAHHFNNTCIITFQANYTDLGEFKVYRGKKNPADVGRVITFNGDTGEFFLFV